MKQLTILLIVFSSLASAQELATSFKSTEVSPGIYMLDGVDGFGGGNVSLLVGDDHIVLIDDGLDQTVPALLEAATKIAGRAVDFVINTHVHPDHLLGNAAFRRSGVEFIGHENLPRSIALRGDTC